MSRFLLSIDPLGSLIGLLLLVLGIGLLYAAWRRSERNWPLIGAGWASIALAYWPWMNAAGFDRGAALASLLPGVLALLLIIARTDWRQTPATPRSVSRRQAQTLALPWRTQTTRLLTQLLIVGLLSLSAALGAALVVYALLDTSIVNRMMAAASVALLLWPALMVWSSGRDSLRKPALWFIGLSLLGWLSTPAFL